MHPGQVPLIGQQDAKIEGIVLTCYLGLIPVVAKHELERLDSYNPQDIAQIVADKAFDIAQKAVGKLGIRMAGGPR